MKGNKTAAIKRSERSSECELCGQHLCALALVFRRSVWWPRGKLEICLLESPYANLKAQPVGYRERLEV
ncbi:unnamed protein product [Sphagnum troendelagicum]|uniref:Uncharacterized protein n=3 Tax=Sphagnum TaxID=13804 RepID=A0ABP0UNH5_9BRYO